MVALSHSWHLSSLTSDWCRHRHMMHLDQKQLRESLLKGFWKRPALLIQNHKERNGSSSAACIWMGCLAVAIWQPGVMLDHRQAHSLRMRRQKNGENLTLMMSLSPCIYLETATSPVISGNKFSLLFKPVELVFSVIWSQKMP